MAKTRVLYRIFLTIFLVLAVLQFFLGAARAQTIVSPAAYQIATVALPPTYTATYIDRGYWFMSVPSQYLGLSFIRTAVADARNTSASFLTFNVNKPVTLYVLYSASVVTGPNWLTANFTPTGEQATRNYHTWNVWRSNTPLSGNITLGGNMATGLVSPTAPGMYVVVIEEE